MSDAMMVCGNFKGCCWVGSYFFPGTITSALSWTRVPIYILITTKQGEVQTEKIRTYF